MFSSLFSSFFDVVTSLSFAGVDAAADSVAGDASVDKVTPAFVDDSTPSDDSVLLLLSPLRVFSAAVPLDVTSFGVEMVVESFS